MENNKKKDMKKGIQFGNGLDFYRDLAWIMSRVFDNVLIGDGITEKRNKVPYAKSMALK